MPNYDASSQNEKKSTRVYKDLNLNFTRNPVTGDVATVTDVNAVKRSIRNLLLTNHYDRPFHPEVGSGIPNLLFENFGPITANQLSREIETMILNYQPRARVDNVECYPVPDTNTYDVRVYFYVENMPAELIEFQTILETLR